MRYSSPETRLRDNRSLTSVELRLSSSFFQGRLMVGTPLLPEIKGVRFLSLELMAG